LFEVFNCTVRAFPVAQLASSIASPVQISRAHALVLAGHLLLHGLLLPPTVRPLHHPAHWTPADSGAGVAIGSCGVLVHQQLVTPVELPFAITMQHCSNFCWIFLQKAFCFGKRTVKTVMSTQFTSAPLLPWLLCAT